MYVHDGTKRTADEEEEEEEEEEGRLLLLCTYSTVLQYETF